MFNFTELKAELERPAGEEAVVGVQLSLQYTDLLLRDEERFDSSPSAGAAQQTTAQHSTLPSSKTEGALHHEEGKMHSPSLFPHLCLINPVPHSLALPITDRVHDIRRFQHVAKCRGNMDNIFKPWRGTEVHA